MKPKLVTIDIETTPHKSYHWRLFKENISINQLQEPTEMLSYAYSINGGKVVFKNRNDQDFHTHLYEVLEAADAVITWNGDGFDLPHIDREFLCAGLPPRRPIASIDLVKVFKKQFRFASNKLDFAARMLLNERKLDTGGFDLWPAAMNNDPKAWRLMERYNKRDTALTWKLYKILKPWMKQHPFLVKAAKIDDREDIYDCPSCGFANHNVPDVQRRTRCFAIRQVRCDDCGHWFDGRRKKI